MGTFSLAVIPVLLVTVVLAAGADEAKRGGGGRGGGGGGKPSGSGTSKPSSDSSVTKNGSAKSGSSSVYNPGYAPRHGAFSNFFLWACIFHDFDDDYYEEEYGEANADFGGWAVMGAGAVGIWFLISNLRKCFAG